MRNEIPIGQQLINERTRINSGDLPKIEDLLSDNDNNLLKATRVAYGSVYTESLTTHLPTESLETDEGIDITTSNIRELSHPQLVKALEYSMRKAVDTTSDNLNPKFLDEYDRFIEHENLVRDGKAPIYTDGHKKLMRSAANSGIFASITGISFLSGKELDIDQIDSIMLQLVTKRSLTALGRYHMDLFSEIDSLLKYTGNGQYWDYRIFNFDGESITLNENVLKRITTVLGPKVDPTTDTTGCGAFYSECGEGENGMDRVYNWSTDWSIAWLRAKNP